GVVNVTPDSFSDGGQYLEPERAIAHGQELLAAGADLLDVGGESTRPGAEPVAAEEELARVVPVIEALAAAESGAAPTSVAGVPPAGPASGPSAGEPGGPPAGAAPVISVDTSKLAVAEAALAAGAAIVNDVTALRGDPEIAALCAERGAGLALMHMRGTPRTMQDDPSYEDVVAEVKSFLAARAEAALAAGVPEDAIWLDPGIGFGKTPAHNLELIARLGEIAELGFPLLVGTSRKRFIGSLDGSPADRRLGGTIASGLEAWRRGAAILRVHDVGPMRQALATATAIDGVRAR
ncbi:MAG TPA: dihydropteroate synthase, partial [Solirubrobacterales bacterium]|nr:dihydropteroate synthase [Solirubrobacterales bacterium]